MDSENTIFFSVLRAAGPCPERDGSEAGAPGLRQQKQGSPRTCLNFKAVCAAPGQAGDHGQILRSGFAAWGLPQVVASWASQSENIDEYMNINAILCIGLSGQRNAKYS